MSNSNNNGPRPLYPTAKTYDEIYAAKKKRQAINRPRFVATKLAALSTSMVGVAIVVYLLLTSLTGGMNAGSMTGEVLFMVSTLIFIGFVGVMLARYLINSMNNLARQVLVRFRLLVLVLGVIIVGSIAALFLLPYEDWERWIATGIVLAFNFAASWIVARAVVGR